jgi:hypothetical protein
MKGAGTGSGIVRFSHPVVGKDLRFATGDTNGRSSFHLNNPVFPFFTLKRYSREQ